MGSTNACESVKTCAPCASGEATEQKGLAPVSHFERIVEEKLAEQSENDYLSVFPVD